MYFLFYTLPYASKNDTLEILKDLSNLKMWCFAGLKCWSAFCCTLDSEHPTIPRNRVMEKHNLISLAYWILSRWKIWFDTISFMNTDWKFHLYTAFWGTKIHFMNNWTQNKWGKWKVSYTKSYVIAELWHFWTSIRKTKKPLAFHYNTLKDDTHSNHMSSVILHIFLQAFSAPKAKFIFYLGWFGFFKYCLNSAFILYCQLAKPGQFLWNQEVREQCSGDFHSV